jgi:LPXTG-motif cell wall-anchored protein
MDVPELGEGEVFSGALDAPNGYFQRDGVENVTITLENDGSENDSYEINNTEFVSTWELGSIESSGEEAKQEPTPDEASPAPDAARKAPKAELPKTGDQTTPSLTLALLALVAVAASVALRTSGTCGDEASREDVRKDARRRKR